MKSRIEKNELLKHYVFGRYSETYYGALKSCNPSLSIPEVITGIIDTTTYNRIPTLYERLFAWIDEVNSTTSEIPLEVVIIGVGNNAYINAKTSETYNKSSPQVVEILVALTAIKNRKINLTLIDRNNQSLAMAVNIDEFDIRPYFEPSKYNIDLNPQLRACMDSVRIPSEENTSYKIDKSKFKHIKINCFCADISEVKFPRNSADMLITTFTLQYLNPELHDEVLSSIVKSVKSNGRMLTSDGFSKSGPFFYAVSELPVDSDCKENRIYFKIESGILYYRYFSEKESRVISNKTLLSTKVLTDLSPRISLDKNPQSFAPVYRSKLIKLIDYANHNLLSVEFDYEKGWSIYHEANGALFFSSVLKNPSTAFSYNFFGIDRKWDLGEIHEAKSLTRPNHGRFSEF